MLVRPAIRLLVVLLIYKAQELYGQQFQKLAAKADTGKEYTIGTDQSDDREIYWTLSTDPPLND